MCVCVFGQGAAEGVLPPEESFPGDQRRGEKHTRQDHPGPGSALPAVLTEGDEQCSDQGLSGVCVFIFSLSFFPFV